MTVVGGFAEMGVPSKGDGRRGTTTFLSSYASQSWVTISASCRSSQLQENIVPPSYPFPHILFCLLAVVLTIGTIPTTIITQYTTA